jgi:uncharacterized protein YkwD
VGVPNTSRRLAPLLLTAVLILSGAGAIPASAHPARHAGHHARHLSGHARRERSQGRPRGTHQRTGGTPVKTREAPPRPVATPKVQQRRRAAGKRSEAASETAATIATVLATPCQNTELTPNTADLPLVRAAVLCLVNRTRAEHGLEPLRTNAPLEAAAEDHCAELVSADYFAHVAPDGETPVDRIKQAGYIPGPEVGYVIGENLAWGTYTLSTPQAIVAAWIASPGHLANILEARYTETGIGITPSVPESLGEGNPGATYAQEFGVIVH